MRADLIAAGDQSGCACLISAPRPATCGLDIEVPLSRSNERPLSGDTAARMSTPGAETSGLSRSPEAPSSGPRDENAAIFGASAAPETAPMTAVAEAPAEVTYALTSAPATWSTWIVGT